MGNLLTALTVVECKQLYALLQTFLDDNSLVAFMEAYWPGRADDNEVAFDLVSKCIYLDRDSYICLPVCTLFLSLSLSLALSLSLSVFLLSV